MAFLAHCSAANAIKDFSRVATGRGSCRCEVMRPEISFQPIEVLTASEDREGRLVLIDGNLVAVLVRLSDLAHDPLLRTLSTLICPISYGSVDLFNFLITDYSQPSKLGT